MTQIETIERRENGNTNILPKKQCNQLKYWFFTLNNYTEKDIQSIQQKLETLCLRYTFQEETGESGTPHLQGCLELKKPMRYSEFNLSNKIHWEKVRNVNDAFDYCQKEETRTGKLYKFGHENFECEVITELYPWQKTIVEYINKDVDKRKILWIYDELGNNGKTELTKYLLVKHDVIVATSGGNKDIANLIKNVQENGRNLNKKKTTFIFSFGRSTEGISYKAIESVKDGLITNTKYEASTIYFNNPHVVIFANTLPDETKLSIDRWDIRYLNKGVLE